MVFFVFNRYYLSSDCQDFHISDRLQCVLMVLKGANPKRVTFLVRAWKSSCDLTCGTVCRAWRDGSVGRGRSSFRPGDEEHLGD